MRCLLLLAALALAAAPASAQDVRRTADDRFTLGTGFTPDPYVPVAPVAGGPVQPDVDGCRLGFISETPHFDLTYEGEGDKDLFFYVETDQYSDYYGHYDTTLLIYLPDGTWICDDDSNFHTFLNGAEPYTVNSDDNPLVHIPSAGSGLYSIWVGRGYDWSDDVTYRPSLFLVSTVDPRFDERTVSSGQ